MTKIDIRLMFYISLKLFKITILEVLSMLWKVLLCILLLPVFDVIFYNTIGGIYMLIYYARLEMDWKRRPKHVEAMMEDGTRKVYENVRIHQIFNGPYYFYDENGKKVKLQPLSLILDYTGKDFEDNKQ